MICHLSDLSYVGMTAMYVKGKNSVMHQTVERSSSQVPSSVYFGRGAAGIAGQTKYFGPCKMYVRQLRLEGPLVLILLCVDFSSVYIASLALCLSLFLKQFCVYITGLIWSLADFPCTCTFLVDMVNTVGLFLDVFYHAITQSISFFIIHTFELKYLS